MISRNKMPSGKPKGASVFAISMGERVGCFGSNYKAVWDLANLSRRSHEGAIFQAFGEMLNSKLTELLKVGDVHLAYLRAEEPMQYQLQGVMLSVASAISCGESTVHLSPIWRKSVCKFATGKAIATEEELAVAAEQNGCSKISPRAAVAYWVFCEAERQIKDLFL